MRIIIEIEGAGDEGVRVLNTVASASPQAGGADATMSVSAAQLTATNAGPAPGRGNAADTASAPGMPAFGAGSDMTAATSAGAAPGAP